MWLCLVEVVLELQENQSAEYEILNGRDANLKQHHRQASRRLLFVFMYTKGGAFP